MDQNMIRGLLLALLIICLGVGLCAAEENTDYIMYFQGGVSSLAEGTNGTMVLTIADIIPYYDRQVVNRTTLMPMVNGSVSQLPLNAALVLNGADGETVYLININKWSFDSNKKVLTLDVVPIEFYEGTVLKKFTDGKQDLSADKVGKELSSGLYLERTLKAPSNDGTNLDYCESQGGVCCGFMCDFCARTC